MEHLRQPQFFKALHALLVDPQELPRKGTDVANVGELQRAAAVLLKRFSYDYAREGGDKSEFIKVLLDLLMCEGIEFAVKDLLGTALEHQFNEDHG
jgi:hypothetical protein